MNAPTKLKNMVPRLNAFSPGGASGCEIAPAILQQIISKSTKPLISNALLAGIQTSDDAAVCQINETEAIVVDGIVNAKNLTRNAGAKAGDKLVLGNPVGSGIRSAAPTFGDDELDVLIDPQSSGVLLAGCDPSAVDEELPISKFERFADAAVLGEMVPGHGQRCHFVERKTQRWREPPITFARKPAPVQELVNLHDGKLANSKIVFLSAGRRIQAMKT